MSAGIQNGVPAEGTGVAAEKPDPAGSSKSKLALEGSVPRG
jgi:hypothetical protein